MSRDCTCQGLNENCMFCFGTGVVVGPRSIPTSNAFQSQKSQFRSQRSPRVPRPCPFCHRPVARLSRHIRKAHSGEASATQDARRPSVRRVHLVGRCFRSAERGLPVQLSVWGILRSHLPSPGSLRCGQTRAPSSTCPSVASSEPNSIETPGWTTARAGCQAPTGPSRSCYVTSPGARGVVGCTTGRSTNHASPPGR